MTIGDDVADAETSDQASEIREALDGFKQATAQLGEAITRAIRDVSSEAALHLREAIDEWRTYLRRDSDDEM